MTSGVASVDMEDRTRGVAVMKLEAPGMSEEAPAMGVFVPPFSSSPGGCGGDGRSCCCGGGGGVVVPS